MSLVEPLVLSYQSLSEGPLGRVLVELPDDWTMVLLRPYSEELLAQVRLENETPDLSYVATFARGGEEQFWCYNCIESLGFGTDDDGEPFLVIDFEDDLADEEVFVRSQFYVNFEDPADTIVFADHVLNIVDVDARGPLPNEIDTEASVDASVHPAVAHARRLRRGDGVV